ncbi:MAG: CoB--CoM heterodisulfide reductase iron-sulfur subunit B family protein [Candidatus Helarchaeota archaeon]
MSEFALFVGCVIGNRYPYIEAAGRKIFDKMGVKLVEVPEFGCCPDPVGIQNVKQSTWMAAAAYNLCIAEEKGLDVLTFCNGCFETLKTAYVELSHNEKKKEEVNKILAEVGKEYKGTIKVKYFLDYLYNDFGLEKISELVTRPLDNLKVATFYGCHYGRPNYILDFDDPLRPVSMDRVVEALGAQSVEYLKKYQCCGSAISGVDEDAQLSLLETKLKQIKRVEADLLTVVCPACYMQFDGNQRKVNQHYNTEYKIPVLYLAELVAIAFGVDEKDLGLKFHTVKAKELMAKIP